jgi:hypothetical protein
MTLVLDSGALIAIDRGDRTLAALLKRERLAGRTPRTHGGCVGQVWRSGARQANLARLLNGTEIIALDEDLGRQAGLLLAKTRTADVIDAAIVRVAVDGDEIVTSDPDDIRILCEATRLSVDLLVV